MQELFSRSDLTGLIPLTERAITNHIKKLDDAGLFVLSGKMTANGRPEKLYRFEDLPRKWQKMIVERTSPQTPLQSGEGLSAAAGDKEFRESKESKEFSGGGTSPQTPLQNGEGLKCGDEITRNGVNSEVWMGLNAKNREILERNLAIVDYFRGLKGKELRSALSQWNSERNDDLTERTLHRILQKFREEGIDGLAGRYGKSKGSSTITKDWWEIFLSVYAVPGSSVSVRAAREVVRGYAIKGGEIEPFGDFPSAEAFARRLKSENQQAIRLTREGKDAYKRNNDYWLEVDKDSIRCGDVFVADHAKFDCFVVTKDKRLVRPWISAMCDYKSRMIVGYDLFLDEPNGDHIIIVMKRSFENYGIPKKLLFDNGKDYRRKDIGGGRVTSTSDLIDDFRPTITNMLGIEIKFAIPYNSQTKPIERVFGIFRQYFDKFMPAYVGSDGKKRPDTTKKLEQEMGKIRREEEKAFDLRKLTSPRTPLQCGEGLDANAPIKSTRNELNQKVEKMPVLTFDEFTKLVKKFIEIFNHRVFGEGGMKGMSPAAIWQKDAPVMRGVRADDMAILCASHGEPVRVVRNVLRDTRSGGRYWAEWTASWDGSDQMFYLRIDPEKPKTAYCFYAEKTRDGIRMGAFAGTAELQPKVGLYDDSEEGKAVLQKQMEIKRFVEREARTALKKVVGAPMPPEEILDCMEAAVRADHEKSCIAAGITTEDPGRPEMVQLTRFSGIPGEIRKQKTKGVMKKGFVEVTSQSLRDSSPTSGEPGKSRRRYNEITESRDYGEECGGDEDLVNIVRFRKENADKDGDE